MKIFWIEEYKKIEDMIPKDEPYRLGKVRVYKQLLQASFILFVLVLSA